MIVSRGDIAVAITFVYLNADYQDQRAEESNKMSVSKMERKREVGENLKKLSWPSQQGL